MRDAEHSAGKMRRPASRLRVVLSLLAVVVALLACGAPASATTLTHAPASRLRLDTFIEADRSQQKVAIHVGITDASGPNFVNLRDGQKLTCNGVEFPHGTNSLFGNKSALDTMQITLPLPPPSGAYTFVYTDEAGAQTTFVVPVVSAELLSARDGDTVPIPRPSAGTVGTPAATPVSNTTAGPRTSDQTATLVVRFTQPQLPSGASASEAADVGWSAASCPDLMHCGTAEPCKRPGECGEFITSTAAGPAPNATAPLSLTISDGGSPLGEGFESFPPGPGLISLVDSFDWYRANDGFANVHVHMQSRADAHITWTRS